MATYTFDKIDYGGNTYVVSDSGALQLTGGQVTGPVTFGDSVSIDEATLGDLVINGSASFTNNIQANTINGVTVGSSPKFTDTNTEVSTLTLVAGSTAGTSLTSGGKFTLTAGSKTVSFTMPTIPTVPSNIVNTITTTAGAHTAITSQKGNVSFNVPTTAAHVGIKFGYTTSGNNRAVLQDSSGNLYVTQKDDNTNTTYALSGALSSHKFTSTLTAGGSGSGTSTSDFTLAAGTGITITDDTSARKMTIACSVTNTDEKVKLTSQATSGTYPLIFGPTSITSNSTYQGYYNTGITVNPSTQTVTATTFVGALTGTASGNLTSSSTLDATKLSGTIPTGCYTNTKNTAGTTNKTGTKMFLVAATEQSANPTTYSNSNCYIGTDNCLYSGGAKVLTAHQTAVTSITTTAGTHITRTNATGAVGLTIPTKTSHLTNDSGFISTAAQIIRW